MTEGQIITFYSFKGGTGRTMALANVAWILAANGKRVLVADWDLESPGLHRFFNPFLDPAALADTGGVIDLIRQFEWETTRKGRLPEGWHLELARVQQFAFSLNWEFPGDGTLDFLTAGRQNDNYAVTLGGMDWDAFYSRLGGGRFIEALRDDMKRNYDYVLIDSRTGLSDVADICTVHLPDTLVDCFTLSEQGLDGAANVARLIQRRHGTRDIRILPVPMRVDPAEKLKADAGRALAVQRFAGLPAELGDEERIRYWAAVEVPYRPFYAYEETLAAFGDRPGSPTSLLSAYETLTRHLTYGEVTELPPMDEALRLRGAARFARRLALPEEEIILRFTAEDQVWAEWIEQVLVDAGVRVNVAPAEEVPTDGHGSSPARQMLVISQMSAGMFADGQSALPPLAVYVTDLRALPAYPIATSAFLTGLSEAAATEKILKLVGHPDPADLAFSGRQGIRFPGTDPVVFNVPARNARFTGREDDLQNLRAQLRAQGRAVVVPSTLPVALQGMGGIGKTQVAMEYAHRFKSAYDFVWWIVADPPTFVDSALTDLGARLGIQPQVSVPDTVRIILQSLARGEPYSRWLVIYDNAEDLEEIAPFIPQGTGHVLLTSRNSAWGDRAQSVQLDVFERRESISHLRHRVAISHEEADEVAEVLGDLPIAVAAAGAWLADTGTPVNDYLRQIESHGPSALSVEATWDLSLERLQSRSPAAYRLLQLCSVLAPETALDLIYGDAMAGVLAELDSSVSERMVRGALVQQINRLALLKVDLQRKQILVHRLLQHVVRARMSEEERQDARHRVHQILAASRPGEVDDPSTWPRFRMLWPHLEVTEAVHCTDEAVRQLFIDRVRFIWRRGGLVQGEELARWIEASWLRLEETLTGAARTALRRQLLHLRFHLANILRDQSRFDEARRLDQAILDEQRELLGTAHPHTLMTSGGLAADLRALGRYAEALRRDELTYAAWLEHFGEDHPRTLIALNNLASSYRLAGEYQEARKRDEAVYERALLVQGENHPDTLYSLMNVSRDLREVGDYQRSIRLLESVHQAYGELLGPDSVRAALARVNLAVSLRAAGKPDRAAALLENTYELLTEVLGPSSPETLACRLSRAVNLLARNNPEEAGHELEVVRARYEDNLGAVHPHTLASLNNLAVIALGAGEYQLARKRAARAAEEFGRNLGADHPYTMAALINLGISLARDGDPEAAVDPMSRAAERLPYILGPSHPYTLRCRANLALLRRQLGGSGPEADETRLLAALGNVIGHDHSVVKTLRDGNYAPRILELHPF